jgi:hypothetical protein
MDDTANRSTLLRRRWWLLGLALLPVSCAVSAHFGSPPPVYNGLTLKQSGVAKLPFDAGNYPVYYPAPYTSPPNLVIENLPAFAAVTEQAADHFTIRKMIGPEHVAWNAEGIPVQVPATAVQVTIPAKP